MSKTYAIRMSVPMRYAARTGWKLVTRRTNRKWLKVKAGDRLRVLQSGGLILEATADARLEQLSAMTEADVLKEGLRKLTKDGGTVWKFGIADADGLPGGFGWPWGDWKADPIKAFAQLWDSLNGDKPDQSFADDPEVVVLEFKVVHFEADAGGDE